ncbi:DNA internalization-related competence protein ComEC/Rec2 [Halobacillus mangrovi]|nr:DNA internalization-related competence protein ComEC/Rec2 [Halobacillus mangrovi]
MATKEGAKVLIILFLPPYALLAGAAPSVLRATLMAGLVMLSTFSKWKVPLTDILSLVALSLLILSPSYLDHLGFQFSFLVTMSLILSFPLLKQTENPLAMSALISFVSQTSILPLQLYYFFEFNPLSLFANLLLVPYFSFFVIPFLMMLLLCSFILPQISLLLSQTLFPPHTNFLSFLETHSNLFDIQWVVGEINRSFIIVCLVLFIIMMRLWIKQKLVFAFAAGVASVGVLMVYSILPYFSPYGRVTMLDVGQGDSFVVELPYRRGVIMIDAAGPPVFTGDESKTAEQIILPYLKSRGIFKLDAIIITHEDTDHSGSVQTLANEMKVGNLVVSLYYPKIETVENVVRIKAGEHLVIGGQDFNLLHPSEDTGDANDNSIVLTATLGGLEWIFTGDASAEIEKLLIKVGSNVNADVLKVGHHGSNTSTSEEWVKHVSPSVALISAGLDNRYGHPHEEVVERLSAQGVVLFSTPDYGAVQYDFSSQRGTFSSFLPYNASRE